jgi:Arc/MetJ-type ribon-helix-helix transcriptional regulator
VIRKPRVVTFRMDQATWDFMRQLVPYTRYKKASSFIREGIELLLKQEEEQPSGWSVGRSPGGSQTQLSVRASSDVRHQP